MNEIVELSADVAWPLVLDLVQRADDDYTLAFVGSGPLENLIALHGGSLIKKIEAEASTHLKFRRALTAVWGEKTSEEVFRRARALVEGEPPL